MSARLQLAGQEIAAKVIDGEAVLINLATGMYYSMDDVGGFAWSLLAEGHSLEAVAQALAQRYDVAPQAVEADVLRLGSELLAEELVTLAPESAAASGPAPAAGGEKLPYQAPQLAKYDDMAELFALDPPLPGLQDAEVVKGNGGG